jgi:chromosome segregation ATPase
VSDIEHIEKRQSRIEDAIERLTEISADLNKMLAVQEQRLSQQERSMGNIEDMVEKRRVEDTKILDELEEMRKEQKDQHKALSDKMTAVEKIIWTYLGGFSVIIFLISYGPKLLEFFAK